MKKIMRIVVATAVACIGVVSVSVAAEYSTAVVRHNLHIPRQTLDVALKDLAQQTGLQIVRFSDAVKGDAMVGPLNGNYSAEQALRELLAPTGLTYRPLNERALAILPPRLHDRSHRRRHALDPGAVHEMVSPVPARSDVP